MGAAALRRWRAAGRLVPTRLLPPGSLLRLRPSAPRLFRPASSRAAEPPSQGLQSIASLPGHSAARAPPRAAQERTCKGCGGSSGLLEPAAEHLARVVNAQGCSASAKKPVPRPPSCRASARRAASAMRPLPNGSPWSPQMLAPLPCCWEGAKAAAQRHTCTGWQTAVFAAGKECEMG